MCTARLIANPVSHKLKAAPIDDLLGAPPRPACRGRRLRCTSSVSAPSRSRASAARGRGRSPALARRRRRVGRGGGARDPRQRSAPGATTPSATTRADSTPPATSPKPLLVTPEELDEAITRLPLELVAGLQVAIANVALVAEAGVSEDVAVDLPQGQRVMLREVPVGSAAVYVPGGRAPYPSTVVMGVVTARAAGVLDVAVCAPPGADGRDRPGDPRHLPPVRRRARLPHGRRAGDRGARLRHRDRRACRRDRRPRQPVRAGGQATSSRRPSGSTASPVPAICWSLLGARRRRADELRLAALDMLAQAEHGEGSLVVAVSLAGAGLRRARRRCSRRSSSNARRSARRRSRSSRSPTRARRWRSPTRSHPSTCS